MAKKVILVWHVLANQKLCHTCCGKILFFEKFATERLKILGEG